ncbi:YeeE/YedE family protein [Microbulbifer salipaludis]|uniref:YeeE/YedE family protein n=1 Tax=Microbulbifer salipaludis TaxID=187980 RepID=A0ABS3E9C0_9GAMM|nr:YeeE/YedE family protein [Microbulbifer salipaludis]MBN8431896.1 YeeE/YedE family protein [Microbulbifer salipaludis]
MNKVTISAFVSGLIFSFGLLLSGMANPEKVLGFLDLFGAWDPSLALVMGGAIAVGLPAFLIAQKRTNAILGEPMHLPANRKLDKRLLLGSLAFGVGWGLAGFCPGPGIVASGALEPGALVFVLAMVSGMLVFRQLERRTR